MKFPFNTILRFVLYILQISPDTFESTFCQLSTFHVLYSICSTFSDGFVRLFKLLSARDHCILYDFSLSIVHHHNMNHTAASSRANYPMANVETLASVKETAIPLSLHDGVPCKSLKKWIIKERTRYSQVHSTCYLLHLQGTAQNLTGDTVISAFSVPCILTLTILPLHISHSFPAFHLSLQNTYLVTKT